MDTIALNNDNMAEKQPWQKPQLEVLDDENTAGKAFSTLETVASGPS